MSTVKAIVFAVVGLYALFAAVVYFFQERFIFLGDPISQDHVYQFDAVFEEQSFTMPDGASINTLYFHAEDPKGVIYYHHGNGGELPRWGEVSYFFLEHGYDVLMYDYRGYGKSTGHRSEANLLSDADFLYRGLQRDWPETQIIVYGRSLGSGLASYVAGEHLPKMLILETPFFSLREMAARYFPFLPSAWLVQYRFPNATYLAKSPTMVHIFHGTEDLVVPMESGRRLFDALDTSRAEFYEVPGANHHNLLEFPTYRQAIGQLLE